VETPGPAAARLICTAHWLALRIGWRRFRLCRQRLRRVGSRRDRSGNAAAGGSLEPAARSQPDGGTFRTRLLQATLPPTAQVRCLKGAIPEHRQPGDFVIRHPERELGSD